MHVVERLPGDKVLKLEQFIGDREHRHQEGLLPRHRPAGRMMGRRRIGIIDDADWFNPESANSLLKLHRRAAAGRLLLLLGTSRSRQLPTILSRVQVVRFARPAVGRRCAT